MNLNNLFHVINTISSQNGQNGQGNQNQQGTGLNLPGGGKGVLLIIIIIIIVMVVMQNSDDTIPSEYNNYDYNYAENYNSQTEYASDSSFFEYLFGGQQESTNNTNINNSNYVSYEDESIKNTSKNTYTLMIYMCGSNLESDGGYASADIEEMLKATLSNEINVLIYTGGARRWYDFGISNKTNQIYKIDNHKLKLVKDNLGLQNMSASGTLSSFLSFCKDNYKADKYSLIMWDHGGGAVAGFGMDQNAAKNDTLTIDEIKQALRNANMKLEFVGFDACLMANMETAYALKDHANYLVASEETEPGTGWNYIKIFNSISSDSSQKGNVTGKVIVDSFIASNSGFRAPDATLSCMDLSKMDDVYENIVSFLKDIKGTYFDKNKYNTFSKGIAYTKAYNDGTIDTLDLIDFANNMNVPSSSRLISSVQSAIDYNKTNSNVRNSNGMSIFIPNKKLSYYDKMLSIYKNIGIGSEYTNVLTEYVNLLASGRKPTYVVNNNSYTQDSTDYSSFSWYDILFRSSHQDFIDDNSLDIKLLKVVDKGDYFALQLKDKDWEKITKVESVVWYDDGKGYIDMGNDSYFELDQKGDLKIEFDGTWLAINGDNIHYEVIERTDEFEKGKVPAVVNDERVFLILYFDKQNPDGEIIGYEPDYEDAEQMVFEKGLRPLMPGDTIDYVADYYDYNGGFEDEHYINDKVTVGKEPLKIFYESLGDGECLIYYRLTDIFGNVYYTEPVIME